MPLGLFSKFHAPKTEPVDINEPGVEVKKSACYFCHQNCGVLAYVKDGDVIKIEGDPNYINEGGLCCRGNIALLHVNHPARINHVLKRAGEKGENKWMKIPWDQGIKEVAERLNQIKAESGAEAVATAGGTTRTDDWARRRFMNLFGSPNSFHNALLCWIPTFMVETAISGWSPFETDLGSSKVVILWGMNPGASTMPGMKGYTDLHNAGLKIIVVDPRFSETASKADLWLPLRPGSDTALSLAMLHTIIFEGLYDAAFVNNWCIGWEDLVEHMRQYTPEWAAPITWLEPDQIREAARMYANNKPGNIQWGCTWDQMGASSGAGSHARALMRAITGNLDCPGGDLMPGPSFTFLTDEELEANDWLPEEQKAKQIGSDRYKLTSWPGYQLIHDTAIETWGKAPTAEWMCEAHGPSVFKAILTGDPYRVRALIVMSDNPINSYGDSKMTMAALREVEFMVTVDYWMTPSALYSDYVFPPAGALERPVVHTNYGVTDSILCSQRAMQPKFDRHTDFDFWKDLGLATGQPAEMWPWETLEDAYYDIIKPLNYPVSSYDEFVEKYRMFYPPQRFYKYGDNGFCTPSRRVELRSSILEQLGLPGLPTYTGCAENEFDTPEVAEEYPIVLTTGGGFMPYHHSEQFQIATIRYIYPDPYFTINPELAEKLDIHQGDWCWIETRRGRIRQRANVEPQVDPRVIYAPRGWWFPERGVGDPKNPFGCLDSNVNVLTSVDEEHCDPIGGSWANRGLMCKVYRVLESEMDEPADTDFSIPGSAKEPGIHRMPSEAPGAYPLKPYNPGPDFDMPEGLEWNRFTHRATQPETGYEYDPNSGWLVDKATNTYYDLYSGLAYDSTNECLVDPQGIRYDMATRERIVLPRPADIPEGLEFNDNTGVIYQPETGYVLDESGWLVGPDGTYYDLYSGYAYNAQLECLTDANGNCYDMTTREPLEVPVPEWVPEGLAWNAVRQVAYQPETGFVYDAESGWLVDEAQGVWYDLYSGYAYDPTEGNLVDMQTGLRYDLTTREPLDPAAAAAFAEPAAAAEEAVAEVAEVAEAAVAEAAPVAEAAAGMPVEIPAGFTFDPATGFFVDDATGVPYDPKTGYAYNAAFNCLVDPATGERFLYEADNSVPEWVPEGFEWDAAAGKAIQAGTGYVLDPASGWLVDEATGVQYDAQTGYAYNAVRNFLFDKLTGKRYDVNTREEL